MEVIILLHVHAFDRIERCNSRIDLMAKQKTENWKLTLNYGDTIQTFIHETRSQYIKLFCFSSIDSIYACVSQFWTIANRIDLIWYVWKGAAVGVDSPSITISFVKFCFHRCKNLPSICAFGLWCDDTSDSSAMYSMANVDAGSSKHLVTIKISAHRWRYISAILREIGRRRRRRNIFRKWKSRFLLSMMLNQWCSWAGRDHGEKYWANTSKYWVECESWLWVDCFEKNETKIHFARQSRRDVSWFCKHFFTSFGHCDAVNTKISIHFASVKCIAKKNILIILVEQQELWCCRMIISTE